MHYRERGQSPLCVSGRGSASLTAALGGLHRCDDPQFKCDRVGAFSFLERVPQELAEVFYVHVREPLV